MVMSSVSFRCAETSKECEAAFELVCEIFNGISCNGVDYKLKKLAWRYYGSVRPENIIIGLDQDKIVGVLRVCPVVMPWRDRDFRVAGLSSICLAKEYQGQGFGRVLMEKSVAYLDDQNYEFSFLVARKNVDYFYTKFGFFGASSYQSLKCQFEEENFEKKLAFGCFKIENSAQYLEFFHSNYKQCFGAPRRGKGFWHYAINRFPVMEFSFEEVIFEGDLIGYLVHRDREIIECGFSTDLPKSIIRQAIIEFSIPQLHLKLNVPHHHMITDSLTNDDVENNSRKCLFGGHMIRWPSKEKIDKLDFSIGRPDQFKSPIFYNIPLLDEV